MAGLLIATIGLELLIDIAQMASGHFGGGPFIGVVLTMGLCRAVYIGKVWARVVLAGAGIMVLLIELLQIACGIGLFALPQVNACFENASAQVS